MPETEAGIVEDRYHGPVQAPSAPPWMLLGIVLGAILTLATTKH